jgi:hypothetical protein
LRKEPAYKFEEEKDCGRVLVDRCGHSEVNRRGSRNRIRSQSTGRSLVFLQSATGKHCRVLGREVSWFRYLFS